MIFKNWLLLNENIKINFDNWLEAIIIHGKTKSGEAELLKDLLGGSTNYYMDPKKNVEWFNDNFELQKDRIIKVLSKKNIENLNWLSFSLGYLCKKNFFEEDLELAIDVTRRRISSGDLPKSEIGQKGWMIVGSESIEKVREHLRQQQEISNRQKLKLKKSGDTLEEDSNLIKPVIKEKDVTIYFLPSLNIHPENEESKSKIESRKRILCRYGKETQWCTANPSGDYDRYYINNDIYIIHEKDKPKYQFIGCDSLSDSANRHPQFMDTDDRSVEKISLKLQEILDKYLSKQTSCYHFIIDFPDLESYIKSSYKDKASVENLIDLTADKKINELSSQEIEDFVLSINVLDVSSRKIKYLVENLSKDNFRLLSDDQILRIIQKLQTFEYDELSKKLDKDRLEKVLDSYNNNNLSRNTDYHSYLLEKTSSRKKAIRWLLNIGVNLFYSLKILDYLVKNINIGKEESYTIFDTIITLIVKSSNEKLIFGPGIIQTLNEFAKIFGKENINKIDLNRLQDRMNIELVPDGDKFIIKFDKKENFDSIRYAMIKFLAKYHDKIKGIIHYKKLAGGVVVDDPISRGHGGAL